MRYKTMKKSGVDISAITVGTWAIGGANSLGASTRWVRSALTFPREGVRQ